MRIAICDDEKVMQQWIAERVCRVEKEADICLFATGEELLAFEKTIDILFLDIQMKGMDGMEVARQLRSRQQKTILIFVTALEDYVFQAFDVGAFHYLVKPIPEEKFTEILKKAQKEWQEEQERLQCHDTLAQEKYVLVKNGGVRNRVLCKDIVYAEVFNRKIVLHTRKEDIEYYGKMSELERQVGDSFFRPHRAYLVNLQYVEKYNATTICLERGTALISKQKFPAFVREYMKYNQRGRK